MRRSLLLLLLGALFPCLLSAQIPNYLPVTGRIVDAQGNVANGQLTAQILMNGSPTGVGISGVGQIANPPIVVPIISGAFSLSLPNGAATSTRNVCVTLSAVAADGITTLLGPGYECVQASSVPPTDPSTGLPVPNWWCSTTACNLDNFSPAAPRAIPIAVGPPGRDGAQGATGCVSGSGPNGCTSNLVPQNINGIVYAQGYGATCDGVADDTSALQASLAAARAGHAGMTSPLVLPPGKCRTSSTLDTTGLDVSGGGGKGVDVTQISATTTNPNFDILQTFGKTRLSHLRVFGGWDGKTAGLSANCFNIRKDTSNGLSAYVVSTDDVWFQGCPRSGILLTDGAYELFHDLRITPVGLHDVEIASGSITGFQTTTVNFSGQVMLSDAPNGYGLICASCINVSLSGAITTSENTKGFRFTGDGRNDNASNLYFEGTTSDRCIDFRGSSGVGLVVSDNYGPGCGGVQPDDLAYWRNVAVFANDTGGSPTYSDGQATVVRGYSADRSDPQQYNIRLDTFLSPSFVPLGIATIYSGAAWYADFYGVWVDGYAHPAPSPHQRFSSGSPTLTVGNATITCSINSAGQFGCTSTAGTEFVGTLSIIADKQQSSTSPIN